MRKAEHLRFAILAAQREGDRLLIQALKPHGITPSQAEVLRLLQQHGTLSLNGLGQLLVCESGTNPSRPVERVVAAGLVERRTDAEDRRYLQLSLTPEGGAWPPTRCSPSCTTSSTRCPRVRPSASASTSTARSAHDTCSYVTGITSSHPEH
ncbi:MarR family winged helix-turn-helix transcriptional regulator [Streptomyces sp. NPDC097704]|uniref:MarR family winged helix-turn-helix transcriptional regulator n=1 Tax=Streptomyces sp. NPDC097704 TaxID=3157101 RepID=UPI00332B5B4B